MKYKATNVQVCVEALVVQYKVAHDARGHSLTEATRSHMGDTRVG